MRRRRRRATSNYVDAPLCLHSIQFQVKHSLPHPSPRATRLHLSANFLRSKRVLLLFAICQNGNLCQERSKFSQSRRHESSHISSLKEQSGGKGESEKCTLQFIHSTLYKYRDYSIHHRINLNTVDICMIRYFANSNYKTFFLEVFSIFVHYIYGGQSSNVPIRETRKSVPVVHERRVM